MNENMNNETYFESGVKMLCDYGYTPKKTVDELVAEGATEEEATAIVEQIVTEVEKEIARKESQRDMVVGGLWFVGGCAVTYFTYTMADGGGYFLICWGAIIFGAIQFLKGLFNAF